MRRMRCCEEEEVWEPDKTGEIPLKSIPANSDAVISKENQMDQKEFDRVRLYGAETAELKFGKTLVVIPARMASKRLPGKPLLMAGGQALVHWTYAQAKRTKADHVVVATPDREIAKYCQENDIVWMATKEDHPNGTSRCWEIVSRSKVDFNTIIGWQVDEPCIDFDTVDSLIEETGMENTGRIQINTLVCPDCSTEQAFDVNTTKVVFSNRRCHWFSRAPMRGAGIHIGVYCFTASKFTTVANDKRPPKYAEAESLEQLTWIEAGERIGYKEVDKVPISINTHDDWEKFKQLVEK